MKKVRKMLLVREDISRKMTSEVPEYLIHTTKLLIRHL